MNDTALPVTREGKGGTVAPGASSRGAQNCGNNEKHGPTFFTLTQEQNLTIRLKRHLLSDQNISPYDMNLIFF